MTQRETSPEKSSPGVDAPRSYSPMWQLVRARLTEFWREPEAVFWVCGFPIVMVLALGIAFRNQPVESVAVDIVENGTASAWANEQLTKNERFDAEVQSTEASATRLRTGKTDLVVTVTGIEGKREFQFAFDPTRPESVLARNAVNDQLQRAAGRQDVAQSKDVELTEPGGRYIDFLVPGLLGMGLMGGGLWGVGFVTVDMRIRKLLKRFLATPMKKSQFLAGIMISRLIFMIPEVLILLIFSRYVFDVRIHGSLLDLVLLIILGAGTFSGLGLLVASRANTLEAVNGLMNLVMLPMWMLSGIFFSSERFPDAVQPFIKALPLTALIDMLRSIMLEGTSLMQHLPQIGILIAWGLTTFFLALRWFRWS
ncbi:MAG: ABC transporter permease [Planctomycetota bacterium]|nr:ABC transporter permease [Planctomycetota bacterium]